MKRLIPLLCVLLFLPIMTVYSLNLESYRYQSTNILRDDLDYAVNGTDIYRIEGGKILTNLSNLSTGNEELMGYSSDNTMVVGLITPEFMNFKTAVFWGSMSQLTPDYLSLYLDPANTDSITGYGFLSGDWNMEWDANGDGSIDFVDYRYSQVGAEETDLESDIFANIAREFGEGVASLTYRRLNDKYTDSYSDSTYYQSEDYSTNDLTMFNREDNFTDEVTTSCGNLFNLAYEMPLMNWMLRGDIHYNMMNIEDSEKSHYNYFEDLAPATTTITDTELDTLYSEEMDDYSDNHFGAAVRLRNEDEEELQWAVSANFGMHTGSGDYSDWSYDYLNVDSTTNAGNVSEFTFFEDDGTTAPISISGMDMGVRARMEWQIAGNVRFGMGAGYQSNSFTREYDQDYTYNQNITYDDGDNEPDDPDDYTIVTSGGYTSTRIAEYVTNTITVPAGVEVNIGKNKDWFLRFGAIATKTNTNIIESEEIGEVDRQITTITYGDGTSNTTYSDVEYSSTKEDDYRESQTVNFAYGAGWKPAENFSIDLLGMFDATNTELLSTDWFRSLKLSATVSF